ncbi:MAG: tandem-95 repeat protein, partial [Bacteroidia bacterium]|nr:tandem-95 repeat protein [Bacteroidia bacterium]
DGVNDNFDADGDGLADHLDLDADNDGIPDAIEANAGVAPAGYDPVTGTISGAVDANGLPVAAAGGYTLNDFDGDGILDVLDLDADNDGIPDIIEAGGEDTDGDGIADNFTDANNDGMDDALLASPLSIPNTDGTGNANFLDIDSDGDGITDNQEAQETAGYVAPSGTDTDGDGWDDVYDSDNGGTAIVIIDFDGDTTPDYMDTDSDNDSVLDDIEGHDANADGISDIGACVLGTDTDSDGLDDCYDTDNVTYDVTASNAPTQNTDGTVDLDWRDVDDDDDGKLTILDQGDLNENGVPDYLESACPPGFIAIPLLDTAYATNDLYCLIGGSQSTDCNTKMLGAPDGTTTGDVKTVGDSIVMEMGQEVVSNALVIIHHGTFEDGAAYRLRVSEDLLTWTTVNSSVAFDSLSGLNFLFTASSSFNYISLTLNGAGGKKIKFDAIEARIGLFSFATSSDSCIIDGSTNTTCNTEATGLNDGNPSDQLKAVDDVAQFLMNDKVFAGSDVKCYFETFDNDMTIDIEISLDKSSWTLVNSITSADIDGDKNYQFNAPVSFNYIRFVHQGLGGKKLEIDAIETVKALDKCIDAIEAVNDTVQHYENYTQEIAVQANDIEGLNNPLTTIQYTTPSNGTIVLNGDSTFSYTPNANWNGTDSFEYIICNPSNICDTALVYIYVDSIPCYEGRAPEVFTLSRTEYGNSVDTDVGVGNEADALGAPDNSEAQIRDGDLLIVQMSRVIPKGVTGSTLKIYEIEGGSEGNVRVSMDKVTWTDVVTGANPGNPGTYSINVDWQYVEFVRTNGNYDIDAVEAIFSEDSIVCYNPPPVAQDDDTVTTVNTPVTINVLVNDADPFEDTLQVTSTLNGPSNGTVVINPDYTITYTPSTGYTGNDSFEYIVCDTVNPPACDTALVSILIPNEPPTANDDTITTEANTPTPINVTANDTDPENGNLIVNYVFSPSAAGGNIAIDTSGGVVYTPAPGFSGVDSFTVIICDDGTPTGCDTSTVTVTVNPLINDAPTAVNDTAITEINEVIAIAVLSNDTDPENNPLTVDTATAPSNGSVFVDAVGNIIYTPDSLYVGPDTITYIVCDNGFPPLCDTATVFITVSASINDAPLVTDDDYNAYDGFTSTYDVISNDVDLDGEIDSTTVTIIGGPSFGGAVNNGDGTIDYLPNVGYYGPDTMVY